ncbi:SEP-domain-containing protein [Atractiella rhizophila]|nr:SEP-domain-containing protein [Atractiella rhizophila]
MGDDKLTEFMALTSSTRSQAEFFLSSANGNFERAVQAFYESGGQEGADLNEDLSNSAGIAEGGNGNEEEPPEGMRWVYTLDGRKAVPLEVEASRAEEKGEKKKGASSSSGARIATFGSLSSGGHSAPHRPPEDDDSDSEGDDPPNLFAGGEKSGLSVQNPNARRRGDDNELVKKILHQAKTEGAARPPSEPGAGRAINTGGSGTGASNWGGAGYRLGSEDDPPSTSSAGPSATMPGSLPGAGESSRQSSDEETVVRHLTFWKDGFSIEDGPLMKYEENQAVLQAIQEGRAPLSLLNVAYNQPVELRVTRRTTENYIPPPKVLKPFSGSGNRLGSPVPGTTATSERGSSETRPPGSQTPVFQVREGEPTTSLQIRLGDGDRLVGRFNHTHTIRDVRSYIRASRPTSTSREWALMTAFPQKTFEDESQTLKDANLLGAVIVQKYL